MVKAPLAKEEEEFPPIMSHATSTNADYAPSEPYHDFLTGLQTQFAARVAGGSSRFFTTQEGDGTLFDLFLSHIPAAERQFYTCYACRRFVNTYGGLVIIDADGNTASALWNDNGSPSFFVGAAKALRDHVEHARVNGVFISAESTWGTPVTGTWTHMSVTPPKEMVYPERNRVKTAGQMMAEKKEDFRTMIEALLPQTLPNGETRPPILSLSALNTAVALLQTDALYRSEKVLGVAEWLKTLHEQRDRATHRKRDNILWRAVALAPAGYCHPRSSMIGTLLEDIEAGMAYEMVERRFKSKMHPLQYQRPQVAPSEQNIARGEAIIAKLGAANSLKRRYARLDEVVSIWTPKEKPEVQKGGVFGHVKAKNAEPIPANMTLPVTTMTVEKFRRTVLPTANTIEFWVPMMKANYSALTTATDASAPPILQWDHADRRNPVSSYVYHGGSTPASWGLKAGTLCKVNAVADYPASWVPENYLPHMGEGLMVILDGARDTAYRTAGTALFPESMIAELREIRATIEGYSKAGMLEGYEESSACGLVLAKNSKAGHRFRVTTNAITTDYELDRWD
jgi:hypothetical protein